MDLTYVIKRPVMTEKATLQSSELGRYAFVVDRKATKRDIKAAVEKLYNVSVVKVNTMVHKARLRPTRLGIIGGQETKKAIVRLKDGDKIELF
jgi:large subunit ribosomal protein L23